MRLVKKLFLIGLVGIILYGVWPQYCIQCCDREGITLMIIQAEPGEELIHSSIHSVSNTELIETIEVHQSLKFIAKSVRYRDQGGAGMPENTWKDAVFTIEDGWFVLSNINQDYKTLPLQVEEKYMNTLEVNGQRFFLPDLVGGKGLVELTYKRRPRLVNSLGI